MPPPVLPEKYKGDIVSIEQNKGLSPLAPQVVETFMSAYEPDFHSPLFIPFSHPKGHQGIPPTYFQIYGLDNLRDEQLIYERVLREDARIRTRRRI
ncbi:hypothetical protein NKR23_g6579 [Pleurostoma richardsiae]|uniref:Uncharacterized protein n=1 Tax=Pleurostoma richardsiae TaxID=41990 RepID=A0AA38RVZ1_9PEZI|nr:hypothetical protein NKR23_g6579 [Pleurostoma richardsiae]